MEICITSFKLIFRTLDFDLKPLDMKNKLLRVTCADGLWEKNIAARNGGIMNALLK